MKPGDKILCKKDVEFFPQGGGGFPGFSSGQRYLIDDIGIEEGWISLLDEDGNNVVLDLDKNSVEGAYEFFWVDEKEFLKSPKQRTSINNK